MKRRLLLGLAVLLAACATFAGLTTSGASFTSASSSTLSASTGDERSLLHIYSQSSDPDGLTGYYTQPGGSTLAATGTDGTLAVDLGSQPFQATNESRVFTIAAASPLPAGITSIIVTVSLTDDPGTGDQPIQNIGFDDIRGNGHMPPVTLTAGEKLQCNIRTKGLRPSGTVYHPTVLITVTYTGFTGTFFRYSVPFTVTAE